MGDGLRHPADLVAWRQWQESRHPVRRMVRTARGHVRPASPGPAVLLDPGAGADLLVAVEATHTSVALAVCAPLEHLDPRRTAVLAPTGWRPPASYATHVRRPVELAEVAEVAGVRAVLAAGHYTQIGAAAFAAAEQAGVPFLVSQHGALTPFAPPLPRAAHLLAWSEGDAAFWTVGRPDVRVSVTGSELLRRAGLVTGARAPSSTSEGPLTYLGQGHAAELSRARLVESALVFCREHGATYRPHPSERDRLSRAAHAGFRRAGVVVDGSRPLADLTGPVVSVFSTGVLEAAAQGRDAWVDFRRPPAWLGEFWERYAMSRFGAAPTAAPLRPVVEPARRVAEVLVEAAS